MSTISSYRKQALALAISAAVFAPVISAQDAAVLDKVQVTADRRVENI